MFLYLKNNNKFTITVLIVIILLTPTLLFADSLYNKHQVQSFPLLLESGLAEVLNAHIDYIIWSEDPADLSRIESALHGTELKWHKEILSDYSGRRAFKYKASSVIEKTEERDALRFYYDLQKSLEDKQTKVIFEERIHSLLNPSEYFDQSNITAIQEVHCENMISISGVHQLLPQSNMLTKKVANIQVVAKTMHKNNQGQTVLAIPALLEEF